MTQYTRPSASVPVWAESGDKVQPTNPEVQTGWPSSTVPPSRQRFNWVLNFIAQGVRYLLQKGVADYAAGEDYPQYARVQYNGLTYRALINSPTSAPGAVAGEWEEWGYSSSTIQARTDSVLSKSVAGSADVTLTSTEAGNGVLVFTGALTGNINVIVPNSARRWVVYNSTTGSFTLGIKTAGGAAATVLQSKSVVIYCDGSNGVRIAGSANDVSISTQQFTATAGQTSFAISGGYVVGSIGLVTRNGSDVNFTALDATNVVLSVAATAGDIVKVYIFASFNVANAVQKTGDTMTGNLGIGVVPATGARLHVNSSEYAIGGANFYGNQYIESATSAAAGVGGGIIFGGAYNGTTTTQGGAVKLEKTNSTAGDYSFNLAFYTRNNGTGGARVGLFDNLGNFILNQGYMSFGGNGFIRADVANKLVFQCGTSGYAFRNAANSTDLLALDNSGNFNPAGSIPSAIQTIGASVASNALTVTAGTLILDFRSATVSNGAITRVQGAPSNLVVPSGATLGTVSTVQSDLYVLALNNAGTIELAVVNASGGVDLSETGVISTTAISGTSNSANVVYSTSARTGVPYRVIGLVRSTQATAGTWASSPALVQGMGGNALAAMMSHGNGQTWQAVTASRAIGTTYYNTTGKPIAVQAAVAIGTTSFVLLTINSIDVSRSATGGAAGSTTTVSGVVPPGGSYVVTATGGSTVTFWAELR